MTQDEIIEMARQANFYHSEYAESYAASIKDIEAFAKLVAAKEREACATAIQYSRAHQLVWYPEGYSINPNKIDSFYEFQWKRSMDAIRARGEA